MSPSPPSLPRTVLGTGLSLWLGDLKLQPCSVGDRCTRSPKRGETLPLQVLCALQDSYAGMSDQAGWKRASLCVSGGDHADKEKVPQFSPWSFADHVVEALMLAFATGI